MRTGARGATVVGSAEGAGRIPIAAQRKSRPEDWPFLRQQLENLLLPGFSELPEGVKEMIVGAMYEVDITAGNVLIQEVRQAKPCGCHRKFYHNLQL